MIHRERDAFVMECDNECGESITVHGEFSDLIHDAKAEGWKISKDGEDWRHTCPECAGKEVS